MKNMAFGDGINYFFAAGSNCLTAFVAVCACGAARVQGRLRGGGLLRGALLLALRLRDVTLSGTMILWYREVREDGRHRRSGS